MPQPTKDALEETFRDVTDPNYAEPLETLDDGFGFDPVAAAAAIFARTGDAIERNSQAFYLLPSSLETDDSASGARFAAATVTARRTASTLSDQAFPKGAAIKAVLTDSRGAPIELTEYVLDEPLAFAAGVRSVTVRVASQRAGNQGDLPAGALVCLRDDETILIDQPEPLTGGRHAQLDAIGRERSMPRIAGEPDLDYAYRLSDIPDVVSPNAIDRLAAQILSPHGIHYQIYEARTDLPGFVLDHSPLDAGSMQKSDPWFGSLLFSKQTSGRYFAIVVELEHVEGASGGGLPLDAQNAGINAYDAAETPPEPPAAELERAIATLYQAVEAAKGGGVAWDLLPTYPGLKQPVDVTITGAPGDPDPVARTVRALYGRLRPGESLYASTIAEAIADDAPAAVVHVTREAPILGGLLVLRGLAIST